MNRTTRVGHEFSDSARLIEWTGHRFRRRCSGRRSASASGCRRRRCAPIASPTPFAHAFQIRRSIFAFLLSPENPEGDPVPILVVRADPVEREVLVAIGHPYFGTKSGPDRIGVVLSDTTDWEEIAELVTESYRILAPQKLVKLLDK